MFKEIINTIWNDWAQTYYVNVFLIICQLIALFVGVIFYSKENIRRVFVLYISVSLINFTLIDYYIAYLRITNFDEKLRIIMYEKIEVAFALTEFFSFYYLFYTLYKKYKMAYLLKFFSIIFVCLITWFFIRSSSNVELEEIFHISFFISSMEMLFLSIPCLIYFIRLFRSEPVQNLTQSPSFWIVTGLVFYSTLIIPFFLLVDQIPISKQNILDYGFTIHLFLFSILFLFLSKAFSLKKPLTD